MTRRAVPGLLIPALILGLVAYAGCDDGGKDGSNGGGNDQAGGPSAPNTPPPGGGPGGPGGGPGGPGGFGGRERSPIGKVMATLGSPRGSLTKKIGDELEQDPPPWEAIQAETEQYATLAGELAQYDPPKGEKDSWAEKTAAFAGSATAMNEAAQAKDKEAALAAHGQLATSCKGCHDEHRVMRGPGGRGGPGRPPGSTSNMPGYPAPEPNNPPPGDAGATPPADGGAPTTPPAPPAGGDQPQR
jgi:hypothetical protein